MILLKKMFFFIYFWVYVKKHNYYLIHLHFYNNLRGHSQRFVLALPASVSRSQETWHKSLAVAISRLNRLLITPVRRYVGSTLEIMWPRNIQNGFRKCLCFSGIWIRHLGRREQSLLATPPLCEFLTWIFRWTCF